MINSAPHPSDSSVEALTQPAAPTHALCTDTALNSIIHNQLPWIVLVNAPADSVAHQALISLLPVSGHPISSVILMGAGAQAAAANGQLGDKYAALAENLGCELLVCGLAAKNYGLVEDKLHSAFTLTGFMEILSLIHNADKCDKPQSLASLEPLDNSNTKAQCDPQQLGYRVINW